jgi:glutathione synthase/RimK-type ligase-like ATP-grasp enzyme
VGYPTGDDPEENRIAYWNIDSALRAFQHCLPCRWVNSPQAIDMHAIKGYQLQLLAQQGIRIPKTLITNDPTEVLAFKHLMEGAPLIYKPVRGGAHTALLTQDDLIPERLETLANGPIKLQECIDGVDIRVYIVDGELFAMEIQTDALDFREDDEAKRVPITLPPSVATDCLTVANTLGLTFTGIDLRRTPQGEYVFFEANPCPIFVGDEIQAGYPISERLVDFLIKDPS